jgi:hypothetical protein
MTDFEPLEREPLLAEIRQLLPHPVQEQTRLDGVLVFAGGDPSEVIVRVSDHKVSVAMFSVRRAGPCTPVVCPQQIATVNWRRLPAAQTMMVLYELIEAAKAIRRSRYRQCERCGETNPPEWMHDATTCQACAERDLGVVY